MATYLQKRRRRWYAVLEIPKDDRHHFPTGRRDKTGKPIYKPRFVRSLETDSLKIAQRRVLYTIATWRAEIQRAKRDDPSDDAAYWRRLLRGARTDKEREFVMAEIDLTAWSLGYGNSNDPVAVDYRKRATAVGFTDYLEPWLAIWRVTERSQADARRMIERFAEKFPSVWDVTRKGVKEWTGELIRGGLTSATAQRNLSILRTYWKYLQSIEVVGEDDNPLDKLHLNVRTHQAREPFDPADVVKLLRAAAERHDDTLADLIRLAMYSGARIEELCSLKVGDVADDHFKIVAAKTKAGIRTVPLHPELRQVMARLVEGKKPDQHVLSGLRGGKYGRRSGAIGTRFGRLKTKLGFGPKHDFHSIRKTVGTQLENAGVPENVAADLLGHEKPRITYGIYSGGTTHAVKAEALAKLAY